MHLDGARFAQWWADRYTRGLAPDVGESRRAEIASDVFEQHHGAVTSDSTSRAVAWRTVRGVHADLAWRRQEQQRMHATVRPPSGIRTTWAVMTQNWFAPLAVLVGVFDIGFAVAVATEDGATMPDQAIGPVALGALATVLFAGLWLRYRIGIAAIARPVEGPRQGVPPWVVAGLSAVLVVCCALLVVGASSDALVLFFSAFGVLGVTALAVVSVAITRAVRSSDPGRRLALFDGMIIVGVIPALAMFWMVIPGLLAIAVIVGVLTTNPRVQPAV